MKKLFLILLSVLVLTTTLFTACDKEKADPSEETTLQAPSSSVAEETTEPSTEPEETESVSEEETEEETEPTTEEKTELATEIQPVLEDPVEVLYCSYTEKPYFAMLGTCNEGATVIAQIGDDTYSSESYKGWFSLRLPCEGSSVEVTLTQTLNGETYDEPLNYTAKPKTPEAGRWPVVTGGNFQFFLQKCLPDYQHDNLYEVDIYSNLQSRIEKRLETIHSYNPDAEIIYLIVPSAMTVYPELVPEEYEQGTGMSRLDKVTEAINNAGATAIDLKAVFEAHKNDEKPLYYKLDSHWSDYGAYIAYKALFKHISQKYPEAAPRNVDEFNWNPDYYLSGDIAYYMGMSQTKVKEYAYYRTFNFDAPSKITNIPRYRSKTMLFYSDNVTWEQTIKTNRPELPSCMVIRDSYSTQIYDLIAERMDTTHYLGMWNYTWDNSAIKNEQPDYIIYIIAEWNIDSIV